MLPSTTSEEARKLELIAAVAIVGMAFFVATVSLLPLVSEYSVAADYISKLAIGRYGYIQMAAFFAAGLSSLALAVGVREATKNSGGSRLGSALFGLCGVGAILAGIFPTDGGVGSVHLVVSLSTFALGITGMFVLSMTFKQDARWQAFWPLSLVLTFAALVGLLVLVPREGPWVGLNERIFVGTLILWQVLVAFRLRSIAKGASAEQPA